LARSPEREIGAGVHALRLPAQIRAREGSADEAGGFGSPVRMTWRDRRPESWPSRRADAGRPR
jgi:hypothetical protein